MLRAIRNVMLVGLVLQASHRLLHAMDFDKDVLPILAARCLECHGAEDPEAGLSLTDRKSATAILESGRPAIVPGQPEASELVRRIAASDPEERMPLDAEPLAASEIDILRRWIAAGADWPKHWAYRPLVNPPVPGLQSVPGSEPSADWARSPLDSFIQSKLTAHRLAPSPPADKRTLLRRLYFDLIGLPPKVEEVDAFLADTAPDAYERVVDRLLGSPHYGQRWARHWLDVVHFAETHGHDQDRPREHAWPYRDYLIRSLNEDKPFGQFVQEQLAGDVLFPNDPWALMATGLLAAGPWDESSLRDIREDTLDREIGRYLDRDDIVTTVMSTFTSTTVHCARCHEHKFDPISQDEYYNIQAVFAGIGKGNRRYDPDPQVAARRRELTERRAQLESQRAAQDMALLSDDKQAELTAWERSLAEAGQPWQPLQPHEFRSSGGTTLTLLADGSLLASGNRPDKDTYTLLARSDLKTITAIRLEVLTDESLPHHGPGRQDNGNLHLNEFVVTVSAAEAAGEQRIELCDPRADFNQQGWSVELAIDGNPSTAWGVHPEIGKPHRAVFALRKALDSSGGVTLRCELQQTHGAGHLIGRLRLAVTDHASPESLIADVLPEALAAVLRVPPEQRTPAQQIELTAYYLGQKIDRALAALPPEQLVYCGTSRFEPDGSFVPVAKPRTVHVLERGLVPQPLREARPGALVCLDGLEHTFDLSDSENEGSRRAALARWMSDPQNVLVWRSMANRIWQYHFDRGIVETPNDFGRMGAAPTHPELLDWLAAGLRDGGGSMKVLHRLIVTSATYRQASQQRPEGVAVDADNRLMWRMNRRRLDAESIRDALLCLSDDLDAKMGGPSVKQFIETAGVHVTPNVDYASFDVDHPANRRRSIFRFIFRTIPDPFMDALDCPDGSQWTPKRTESMTAIQALATMNDKFVVRQCQRLAEKISNMAPQQDDRVEAAYRILLGRAARAHEVEAVGAYAVKHGWANTCRILINTNEFMFLD